MSGVRREGVGVVVGIKHHKGCTADYPEKLKNEKPRQLTKTDIGGGEVVYQCVDCGAFIVVKEQHD